MNYENLYKRLIESRQQLTRQKVGDGSFEAHHIIPRSIGGADTEENIVLLTPREHYIAHWLLYKYHTGQEKAKLAYGFFMMSRSNINQCRDITARQYERAVNAMRETCTGENNPAYGKPMWSEEQRAAISERQTGSGNSMYGKEPWNKGKKLQPLSEEHKQAISKKLTGRKRPDEVRKKISEGKRGKPKSAEHRRKISEALKGRKYGKRKKASDSH